MKTQTVGCAIIFKCIFGMFLGSLKIPPYTWILSFAHKMKLQSLIELLFSHYNSGSQTL